MICDLSSVCGRLLVVVAAAVLIAGCKQELYSNLSEAEANQMLAVLVSRGIASEKVSLGKERFAISVESGDMTRAVTWLNENGYPKSVRDSIGKVFQKSGIVSSPFEERVRYAYALSEEVAQTLSFIEGVITARVHIVMPEAQGFAQVPRPSSAAVFIKHRPGVDLEFLVPQIKRLVSSSIDGLQLTAVTVVLTEAFATKAEEADGRMAEVFPGLFVREAERRKFWWRGAGVLLLLLSIIAGVATLAGWVMTQRAFRGGRVRDARSAVSLS